MEACKAKISFPRKSFEIALNQKLSVTVATKNILKCMEDINSSNICAFWSRKHIECYSKVNS